MFEDADLIQKEVDPPSNHWCASGHKAPDLFRRSGPGSMKEPTKFFHVAGHGIDGIYCEPCLIIAHHIAKEEKSKR